MPPIRASDELDGMPRGQVVRFQRIPPTTPAMTMVRVIRPVCTSPPAMVAATLKDRNAPIRLRKLEMATAVRGGRAPVVRTQKA